MSGLQRERTNGDCVRALFRKVCEFEPYHHQIEVYRVLEKGGRVLLHAPTGAGKSEAAFVPFIGLRGNSLPTRLIYVLPTRSLVDSITGRFRDLVSRAGLPVRVAAQHGRRPESVLFYADAVVATIDQVISSYVCAPLSLGTRHGNIPAGAVATGFLVLDEVHTLDPERGLQAAVVLATRLQQVGVPFVIMSATLPRKARDILQRRLDLAVIEAREECVRVRVDRKVSVKLELDKQLTSEAVLDAYSEGKKRVLVVCNTVERAIALYKSVKDSVPPDRRLLIHSRFVEEDRERCNTLVNRLLGKGTEGPALVISTQVVEVGLDISCDILLTELCPADSLIQRAGRCARWAEAQGLMRVFGLPIGDGGRLATAPYHEYLVTRTGEVLTRYFNELNGRLNWELEQKLTDDVLSEDYVNWLDIRKAGLAACRMANAAFTGSRKAAAAAVRDNDSVNVSLHTKPQLLGRSLGLLPSVQIPVRGLRKFIRDNPSAVWALTDSGDESGSPVLVRISEPGQVKIGFRYYISSGVSYSPEVGLTFDGAGVDWQAGATEGSERLGREVGRRLETLEEHLRQTVDYLCRFVCGREQYGLQKIAETSGLGFPGLRSLLLMGAVCHDLGKASRFWQKAAREALRAWLAQDSRRYLSLTNREREILDSAASIFLGRFPYVEKQVRGVVLPPHATVSAYAIWDVLVGRWGQWGEATALAIAHHHSVRAAEVPRYELDDGWWQRFRELLEDVAGIELQKEDIRWQQSSKCVLGYRMPPFHKERVYTFYAVVSRCLSLADRVAAGGGEGAILDYENRVGSI
ncbi:MAG TPA: CRISPR-associated helicase Cas3' [Firmicutes bacterium]|nr:CRISPR-associated helicase Cas3' [Candidatus Fermentithermobacillaceae bacterium]